MFFVLSRPKRSRSWSRRWPWSRCSRTRSARWHPVKGRPRQTARSVHGRLAGYVNGCENVDGKFFVLWRYSVACTKLEHKWQIKIFHHWDRKRGAEIRRMRFECTFLLCVKQKLYLTHFRITLKKRLWQLLILWSIKLIRAYVDVYLIFMCANNNQLLLKSDKQPSNCKDLFPDLISRLLNQDTWLDKVQTWKIIKLLFPAHILCLWWVWALGRYINNIIT